MKIVVAFLTLFVHIAVLYSHKLVDDYGLIMAVIFGSILIGVVINLWTKAKILKRIGSGIIFGSLASFSVVLILTIYIAVNIGRIHAN